MASSAAQSSSASRSSIHLSIHTLISNLSSFLTVKFLGENFLIWKSQLHTVIKAYNLDHMLDGSEDPPSQFL